MNRKPLVVSLAALLSALSVQAAGRVEVDYVKPEQFTDVPRNAIDRERTLDSLTGYLQALGRSLPDGQTLKITVTDLDLAGEVRWRGGTDLRVLRGSADWPRIALRWTLADGNRTLDSGEARLSDMNYMFGIKTIGTDTTDLPYEKRLLREWFEKTFPAPR